MYIFYSCPRDDCTFRSRVTGEHRELDVLLRQDLMCPYCGAKLVRYAHYPPKDDGSIWDLSYGEFYAVINGLGFPNETVTHIEPVIAMLKACRISSVDAFEVDERCIIKSITLDNGVTLHLAASGYGAAVYKATRSKDNASFGTEHRSNRESLRGSSTFSEHNSRGRSDSDLCREVHGRARGDDDASGTGCRGADVPSTRDAEQGRQSEPVVVRGADSREAEPNTSETSGQEPEEDKKEG